MSILISHPFCALHLSQVFHDMMYAQLGHAPARTVVQDTELRHQAGWNREVMSEVGEVQVINSEYEQDKEGPSLFASKKQHMVDLPARAMHSRLRWDVYRIIRRLWFGMDATNAQLLELATYELDFGMNWENGDRYRSEPCEWIAFTSNILQVCAPIPFWDKKCEADLWVYPG